MEKGLTPLLYLADGSPLSKALSKCCRGIRNTRLIPGDFRDIWLLLPYLKPVSGFFPGAGTGGRDYTGLKDFDQEMEWRFVPSAYLSDMFSVDLYNDATRNRIRALNERTESAKLTFDANDVERIVVRTLHQKRVLARLHPSLNTKIRTWNDVPLI